MDYNNFKAFIFDFDGTVSDTLNIHKVAFEQALEYLNINFNYNDYLGQTTQKAIEAILKKNLIEFSDTELKNLVNKKREIANILIQTHSTFVDGAYEFLELLYKQGKALYIASSGSRLNVMAGIKALQIENFFVEVVTADDIKKSKPDPEIFDFIVQKYNLQKENTVVIEDSISGLQASVNAGLYAICIDKNTTLTSFSTNSLNYSSFSNLFEYFKNS